MHIIDQWGGLAVRILWSLGLILGLSQAAYAAAVTPGAGTILHQVAPPQAPKPSKSTTGLRLAQPAGAPSASKIKIAVKRIEISGNSLFATSELHGLVASAEGKTVTLGDLERLSARITDYYHAHGYALTRAYIPAQTIKHGVVRFEVLEAHYGKVNLNNRSGVREGLLSATLASLQSGQVVADRQLDRALLLLSDIPGVSPGATFSPGAQVGTSDLNVDANAAQRVTGQISADNFGNQYTGRARVGAGVQVADPLHLGDALSLNLMTAGRGLDYGRAGYDVVVNGTGTQVGAAYSQLHYILGAGLSSLRGYGTASVASAWVRQPFIRSLGLNLYGRLQFNHQRLRDHLDASGLRTDRHLNDWAAMLTGDARDRLLSTAAVTSWSVGWTSGRVAFDDAAAAVSDAATAKTAGQFSKWTGQLVRLQGLGAGNTLNLSLSGQWTRDNLDSAQKLVVGGPYSVRAYDMGVLSADIGALIRAELHHRYNAHWQALAFYDHESVRVNAKPWSTTSSNHASLNGMGIGVNWSGPYRLQVNAYAAWRVGSVPAQLAGTRIDPVRGWLQMAKAF